MFLKSTLIRQRLVYINKVYTETETASVNATATFKIYVLDNETAIGSVRFISNKYLYTLSDTSKWNKKRNEKFE